MNKLLVRILTGVIGGGITVSLIVLSAWGLWLFCGIVSVLALIEFYRISGTQSKFSKWWMIGVAVLVWLFFIGHTLVDPGAMGTALLIMIDNAWLQVLVVLFGLGAILLLFEKQVETPAAEMGRLIMGFMYAFLPFVFYFQLSTDLEFLDVGPGYDMQDNLGTRIVQYDFHIPLGILFLTWMADVMAYFGGKWFGRHPLWPRISPKKTWEGSIAGALGCIGLGFALQALWPTSWNWIVVAAIISVFTQLGDLVESMYKRGLQIKDSGGLLPGHGGILDRFDGLLITLPILYLLRWIYIW